MAKAVTVIYLGSLTHSDEANFLDKTKPHEDQIDFNAAVKLGLIRIPRSGKDIYSRHISITQNQPIKNFQIYYRNLQKSNGRYSLLISSNQLVTTSTDDILITPKQTIYTDMILIKGNFSKITLCIYGNVIKDDHLLRQKCPYFRQNIPIEPLNQSTIEIKKDIFCDIRQRINQPGLSNEEPNNIQEWTSIVNDDGINEQQIENISNISQKLLTTFTSQKLSDQTFVTEFRSGLEQISANLAKIFKNKHLGLYYPSYQDSNIATDLPLSVTNLALNSLDLSLSQQFRGLQILKFMLQLNKHSNFFIQKNGVSKLMRIFVEFFKIGTVVLSTYKNLILQVLISISHWKAAAEKMTALMNQSYEQLYEEIIVSEKQKNLEQRERSREKKIKKSRSKSSQSSENEDKKKKKDKQKKQKKDREKQKDKEKEKQKERDRKKGKQSKSKQDLLKKTDQIQTLKNIPSKDKDQIQNLSFYQVLLIELSRQTNCKQLILVKILLEQILQTITKDNTVSHRVSFSTSLLKDIKYIFNPAGQILNTKSLKQFASCYHPFLNNIQSQGVDNQLITEREKLKNMKKYGINPKISKIINKICLKIAQSQSEETEEQAKTAFDSNFIVMISQLIRDKQKSILYGFGRILSCFKIESSNDIIYLKKIEGAMTMISQYIYKILVQDNGLYTVLNIDQIYSSLINITNCLIKDPSSFTKQLKRKVKQLTNYSLAYDLYNRSEGNFKTICDYFLRIFKFEHYEINKISDFKKKQFDKLNHPFNIHSLSQIANLGNFNQLFPQQPLLQIDVYLKIFTILLQYNKNAWCLFYQNKLVCGFSILYIKLTNFVIFMLNFSCERQSVLINMKKPHLIMQNHLMVLSRLMNLLGKKAQYQTAFNDLIQQDSFQNVQLYQRSFQLYISLFNSINQARSLLTKKAKNLAQNILSSILQIFDKLLQSYQLTSHTSKQSKIKQLWYKIYQGHYVNLKSRAACLSLFAFFIESMENASTKLFNTFCVDQILKLQIYNQNKIKGYLPNNQKPIIQNLIISNIFRNDVIIQTNLYLLIKNLIEKHSQKNPTCQKITLYLEYIFDQIETKLKQKSPYYFQSKKQLFTLQKMVLFTDILRKLNCCLTTKFQDKLLKYLKIVDNIKMPDSFKKNQNNVQTNAQALAYKLGLKIKINIILFLKNVFIQRQQHSQILSFIQMLGKNMNVPQILFNLIPQNDFKHIQQIERSTLQQLLNLINSSFEVICSLASNPYIQSVILYEVFLQKPYKPAPQIMLNNLWNKFNQLQIIKFINSDNSQIIVQECQNSQFLLKNESYTTQVRKNIRQIITRMIYFLCQLTTIQGKQFYSTQSRRNAITYILSQQKDFPFHKLQNFKSFLPAQFIKTLRDYFSYPIIQKPLIIKKQPKRQLIKNKGYMFSKSIFAIIMEGEPTAKSRYQYIGGPWKSGDISSNSLYTPTRQRNYDKIIKKSLKTLRFFEDKLQLSFNSITKGAIHQQYEPSFIQLISKKKAKTVQKKVTVDSQIKLLNIPLVIQNLNAFKVDPNQFKKISPSPSKKYSSSYYKTNPPMSVEYDGLKRLKSPSPPPINIPTNQNLVGFNSNGNGQNSAYNPISNNLSISPYNISGNQNIPIQPNPQIQSQSQAYINSNLNPGVSNQTNQGYPVINNPSIGSNPFKSVNQNEIYSPVSKSVNPKNQYPQNSNTLSNQTKYPNPYYGDFQSSSPSKIGEVPSLVVTPNLTPNPYTSPQLQRIISQEQHPNGNIQPIRSASNSTGRQNNVNGNYNINSNSSYSSGEQTSYYNNQTYSNDNTRIGGYQEKSHLPYQKNYPNQSSNYPNNPKLPYGSSNVHTQGNSYYNQSNYTNSYQQGGRMMDNNPHRQGNYNSMNRPYNNSQNPNYSHRNNSNYSNYPNENNNQYGGINSNYINPSSNMSYRGSNPAYTGPANNSSSSYGSNTNPIYGGSSMYNNSNLNYNQNVQQERQFNDAILLVTQLRGNLPEQMKVQKKNRLNQILAKSVRIQNRVKQYINNLKA